MKSFYYRAITLIVIIVTCTMVSLAQHSPLKHIVTKGETIELIAKKYNVEVADIVKLNPSASRYIYIGMELLIPEHKNSQSPDAEKKSSKLTEVTLSDTTKGPHSMSQSPVETVSTYVVKPKARRNQLKIGPNAGLLLGSINQPKEATLFDGSGTGFKVGAEALLRFGDTHSTTDGSGYFGVALGLSYGSMSFGIQDYKGESVSLNVLSAPISARIYPFVSHSTINSLYFEAGLNIFSILSTSPDRLTIDTNDYTIQLNMGDNLSSTSIKPLIGIGYVIPGTGLSIHAQYSLGLSGISDAFQAKLSTFGLSLSWMFNIAHF